MAVGAWFGVGLGRGHSVYGYVPYIGSNERLVFVVEETGLVGGMVVLGALTALMVNCFRRSGGVENCKWSYALGAWALVSTVISAGSALELIPAANVQLPFFDFTFTANIVGGGLLGLAISERWKYPTNGRWLGYSRKPRRTNRQLINGVAIEVYDQDHGDGSRGGGAYDQDAAIGREDV